MIDECRQHRPVKRHLAAAVEEFEAQRGLQQAERRRAGPCLRRAGDRDIGWVHCAGAGRKPQNSSGKRRRSIYDAASNNAPKTCAAACFWP